MISEVVMQEELARNRICMIASNLSVFQAGGRVIDLKRLEPHLKDFLGLRTTLSHFIDSQVIKRQGVMKLKEFLGKVCKMGIHTSEFTTQYVATIPESGAFDFILTFLQKIPGNLKKFVSPLTEIAKVLLPVLSVTKLSFDIGKIMATITQKIVEWISGRIKDNSKWIASQVEDPTTPIGKLCQSYLAYQIGLSTKDSAVASNLRANFYSELAACETCVFECKRYGKDWTYFRMHLERGMTDIPSLQARDTEPTVLVLSGKAGTGKSTLWRAVVGKEFGCPNLKAVDSITHTWNIGTETQTGMSGKKIILFDDFAQDRKSNEALAVINLVSRAPVAIVSANIIGAEVKGLQVHPDLLVLCTNSDAKLASQDLTSSDALLRRYDIDFKVTTKIDFNDLNAKIGTVEACSAYSDIIGQKLSYIELKQLFTLVHRKKRAEFKQVTKNLEEIFQDVKLDEFDPTPGEIGHESTWQKNDNFKNDWKRYVIDAKDEEEFVDVKEEEIDETTVPKPKDTLDVDWSKLGAPIVKTNKESGDASVEYYMKLAGGILFTGLLYSAPAAAIYEATTGLIYLYGAFSKKVSDFLGLSARTRSLVEPTIKCVIASAVAVGVAIYAFKATQVESGTTKTAKPKKMNLTVDTNNESGGEDQLHNLFKRATGTLRNMSTGECVNCVFVGGHYILGVRHFFIDYSTGKYYPDGTQFSIVSPAWKNGAKMFSFENNRISQLAYDNRFMGDAGYRADVLLYKLDEKQFSASKNIISHFWDGSYDLTNHPVTKMDLSGYKQDGTFDPTFEISYGKVHRDKIMTLRTEGSIRTFHIYAEADYVARPASCGSIVRLTNSQNSPILGVHTARGISNPNSSYFHFVTRQSLEKAIEADKAAVLDIDRSMIVTEAESGIGYLPPQTTLVYLGRAQYRTYQNTKSTLRPSKVFECLGPHKTAPSVLHAFDQRLPSHYRGEEFFREIFSGYAAKPGTFLASELLPAYNSLRDQFGMIIRKSIVRPKKLTLHEAINGIAHIPGNTRMEMNTSTGYPYVCRGESKKKLFTVDKFGDIFPNETVVEDYKIAMKQLSSGIVPFTPFILTLKDERVKLAKISKPKTRLFACGNVINFLVCRTYFYTFMMACYHAHPDDLFFRPSMDRLSLDWHEYAAYMTEVGHEGFDFDFKFFDRTLSHVLLYMSTDLMLTGMDVTPRERATLLELICSPVMIWRDEVFTSCGINMSGVLITYTVNCIVNELMHRAAWTYLSKVHSPRHLEMSTYRKYVRGMRGGDDTVTTVHPHVQKWYNGVTVAQFLNERGMEVTSPDKDQNIVPFKYFLELSFLKNKTKVEYGYYVPLSELDSLIESCYWIRLNQYNVDPVAATQDNVMCALRGIFFHGREIFNSVRDQILDACPDLQLSTYEDLTEIWKKFFHFPGAHADYATRDEGKLGDTDVKPHRLASLGPQFINNMIPVETQGESGPTAIDAVAKSNLHQEKTKAPEEVSKKKTEDSHKPGEVGSIDKQQATVTSLDGSKKRDNTSVGTTVTDGDQVSKLNPKLGHLQPTSKSKRATSTMNDTDWTLAKLEKKFTFVTNITWDIQQQGGTSLKILSIPKDIIVTAAQKAPFDATTFYKFREVTIKLVLKASPFYAGCIVAGFIPVSNVANNNRLIENNGVIAKLSQDESIEYDIPFRWYTGYLQDAQSIGYFHVNVLSPLTTGAGNPNSIDIAVYAAIDEAIFKVPEIIPSNAYSSHKFDKHIIVQTMPESGRVFGKSKPDRKENNPEQKSRSMNVNDHVHELDPVVLCAGPGMVTTTMPSHFQDGPTDLVQLLKRFRRYVSYSFECEPLKINEFTFTVTDIVYAASSYLSSIFAFWRGSVIIRASVTSLTQGALEPTCYIHEKVNAPLDSVSNSNYAVPDISGLHHFDCRQSGQVYIPYIARTFVSIYGHQLPGDNHLVYVSVCNGSGKYLLDIDLALGDDFHTGLFLGTQDLWNIPKLRFEHKEIPYITTKNEAGVIEFIDRALETTLPIAEAVSELGSLLDAHPITYQPYPVHVRTRPLGIATDLVNYKETLVTTNHNGMSLPDKETFGMLGKETDIKNLLTGIKCLEAYFPWNAADKPGTILREFGTGPSPKKATLIDQLPRLFNYWRGGTIYIFDIIATEQHRGQLIFSYSPSGKKANTVSEATQTYFTTYDLTKGRGTIAIMCPYLSPIQYSAVSNLDGTGDWTYPGILQVFVQNPLRASTTVAPNVEVLVYKTYASDFDVSVLGNNQVLYQSAQRAFQGLKVSGKQ